MGRSNAVILVLGLGGCLALSLILKGALELSAGKGIPQTVVEIRSQFGGQLEGTPSFRVEGTPWGPFGYLRVKPSLHSGGERLALSLGQYLWRCCAEKQGLAALVVSCELGAGKVVRFQVNSPRSRGRAIRRLGPHEIPSPSARRPVKAKRPSSRESVPGKRP